MSERKSLELRVSVDVGYRRHSVAIGWPDGQVLEEFEIRHRPEGFQEFFSRIEKHQKDKDCGVAVAMEGYNGYARPLDSLVRQRGYRLYNINNLKLARFKEIFPGAAKKDRIDARKGLELFQLSDHLPLAKEVLQEVKGTATENEILKRLTRRRRRLVNERVRVVNNLQTDLQAVCPGLLEITTEASNQWFLNFLLGADTLPQLARLRKSTLLKIPAVGRKYASLIQEWQKRAHFSEEIQWVDEMIHEDAQRCLELDEKIRRLDAKIEEIAKSSKIAKILRSIPGFGPVCTSELAGEIGTVERFSKEGSLALYLGMSTLDNSSGNYQGTKQPKHVNTRAKAAMMTALDRHRKYVPESQRYYEKKRSEGKKHNQAIRALGRHLSRIIYKMLNEGREYQMRPEKGNTKSRLNPRSLFKTQIRKPKISAKGKK
ncbi:MAG TPA: IS110 family transposase [Candidatus Binatia bacterium]|nr:IS110 family transposase [Candidatus Binatia bacterium]